ncbi:DinB family protein [Streptomyces gilvus]|uniref:DinB family protein n=1 Tax=Streptomyces gilvus TaxID=2920937 RepID=UPI001F0E3C5C|nr:DinB family protein [Streptomyces sp. CME 23]MCH5670743.1 DinB family protein [Streptomyces sp. CME 23]
MGDSDFSDLRGARFERAAMDGARFTAVGLNGARFRGCGLNHVVMRGVELVDTTIDGEIGNLVVNGVDVAPLVEGELDRRHPDRPKFRPTTADGFREAWDLDERLWEAAVTRARRLPPKLLHASVDGEWSFVQTLRHLAFASQSWVERCVLGVPSPWHPLSLPWDEMVPRPGVPHDRTARPPLDEALALRLAAMATVRRVVDGLTDRRLDERTEPLVGPGWPDEGAAFPVRECLLVVLNEEWCHRMYAERDLTVLEKRS